LSENDIYVITDFGDRLDLLAYQFYQDVTLYWIISAANPNSVRFGSIFIPQGTQLRIPTNINEIINSYNNLNNI
jgi:phage tail protein X